MPAPLPLTRAHAQAQCLLHADVLLGSSCRKSCMARVRMRSANPTLPERSMMRLTSSTPARLATKQERPKVSANCRLSRCAKPKESAAELALKRTMTVEVAAATCGCVPNSSSSGLMIIPPPMPSRPVHTHVCMRPWTCR